MAGYQIPPGTIVNNIKSLLRERYKQGFPIIKEIIPKEYQLMNWRNQKVYLINQSLIVLWFLPSNPQTIDINNCKFCQS